MSPDGENSLLLRQPIYERLIVVVDAKDVLLGGVQSGIRPANDLRVWGWRVCVDNLYTFIIDIYQCPGSVGTSDGIP
jgi:hypothetical protein